MSPIRALRNLLSAAAAVAIVATAACGSDSKGGSTGPKSGVEGKYSLSTVNSHGLPAVIFDEDVQADGTQFHLKMVAKSGYLELKSGGVLQANMVLDIYADGQLQSQHGGSFTGTWEKDENNDVQFESDANDGIGGFFGNISGGKITTQLDLTGTSTPATFVFKK